MKLSYQGQTKSDRAVYTSWLGFAGHKCLTFFPGLHLTCFLLFVSVNQGPTPRVGTRTPRTAGSEPEKGGKGERSRCQGHHLCLSSVFLVLVLEQQGPPFILGSFEDS